MAAYKGRWPLGRGFERFYGFLGGESNSWYPDLIHDNHQIDPPATPGGGLPPLQRPVGQGDRVHPRRQGRRSRQAVLPVPRPAGRARAAPRLPRSGRTSTRAASTRATRRSARDPRPPEGARAAAGGHRALGINPHGEPADRPRRTALAAARHRPPVGLAERRRAAPVRAHGRGVRRLHLLRRRPARPRDRLPRGVRPARQHDHRRDLRQRRERRGRPERLVQRVALLQRHRRLDRAHAPAHRRARQPAVVQPLQHRLGVGVRHAVPLLEALGGLRGRRRRHVPRLLAGAASTPQPSRGSSTSTRSTSSRPSTSCSASSRPR